MQNVAIFKKKFNSILAVIICVVMVFLLLPSQAVFAESNISILNFNDGSTIYLGDAILWQYVQNADYYNVKVRNLDKNTVVDDQKINRNARYIFDENLGEGKFRVWIAAYDKNENFICQIDIISSFDNERGIGLNAKKRPKSKTIKMITPIQNETITTPKVRFEWEPVSNTNMYKLYFDYYKYPDQSPVIVDGDDTFCEMGFERGTYTIRIEAYSDDVFKVTKACIFTITVDIKYSVNVTVIDDKTGEMIKGAIVKLDNDKQTSGTIIDSNGDKWSCSFKNIDIGKHTLTCTKSGYEDFSKKLTIDGDVETTIEMQREDGAFWISGKVQDEDDFPIKGAVISINDIKTVTDEDGEYIIKGLDNGNHTLVVSCEGYKDRSTSVRINYDNVTDKNINIEREPIVFSGIVTTEDGNGLEGVKISFTINSGKGNTPASVTTNSEGSWEQEGFSKDCRYWATPEKSGYTFNPLANSDLWGNSSLRGINYEGRPKDITPPSVIQTQDPTDFAIQGNFDVTFDETIKEGNNFKNISITESGNPVDYVKIEVAKDKIVFSKLSTYWKYSTTYTIKIPAESVTDIEGNPLKDEYIVSFTTQSDPKEDLVKFSGKVTTEDGQGIEGVKINFAINSGKGNTPVSVTTDSEGNWEQVGFSKDCRYWATPEKSGYTFNPLSNSNLWGNSSLRGINFEGSPKDITPPTVIQTQDITNLDIQELFDITFNEKIFEGDKFNNISITKSGVPVDDVEIELTNEKLVFRKVSAYWEYNTTYSITIPSGAVKDNEGNLLKDEYIVCFTTQNNPEIEEVRLFGKVTTQEGKGIEGVTINFSINLGTGNTPSSAITDSNGNWEQEGFSEDCSYNITPQKNLYTFNPHTMNDVCISNLDSGIEFIGTPIEVVYPVIVQTQSTTNLSILSDFYITFSEKIFQGIEFSKISITNFSGVAEQNVKIEILEDKLIFKQLSGQWAYNTTYEINIPSDAVKNEAGNKLKETYTVSFTTQNAPVVDANSKPPKDTPQSKPSTVIQPKDEIPSTNETQIKSIEIIPKDGEHVTEGEVTIKFEDNLTVEQKSKASWTCVQIYYKGQMENGKEIVWEGYLGKNDFNFKKLLVKGTYGVLICIYDENNNVLASGSSTLNVDADLNKPLRTNSLARKNLMTLAERYPYVFPFDLAINEEYDSYLEDCLLKFAKIYNLSNKYEVLDELYYYLQMAADEKLPPLNIEYRISAALRGNIARSESRVGIADGTTLKLYCYANGYQCKEVEKVTYIATKNPQAVRITGDTILAQTVDTDTEVRIDALVNNKVFARNFRIIVYLKKSENSLSSAKSYKVEMQIGSPYFTVNEKKHLLDNNNKNVVPKIIDDRTYVPIRAIIESMGGTIDWDDKNKKITVVLGSKTLLMTAGEKYVSVNGYYKQTDTPIKIINNRTFVPLRVVFEELGCSVKWKEDDRGISISYDYENKEEINMLPTNWEKLINTSSYNGTSVIEYLNSIGVDSSFSNRAKIALLLKIVDNVTEYQGTSKQNDTMLAVLRYTSNACENFCDDLLEKIKDIANNITMKIMNIIGEYREKFENSDNWRRIEEYYDSPSQHVNKEVMDLLTFYVKFQMVIINPTSFFEWDEATFEKYCRGIAYGFIDGFVLSAKGDIDAILSTPDLLVELKKIGDEINNFCYKVVCDEKYRKEVLSSLIEVIPFIIKLKSTWDDRDVIIKNIIDNSKSKIEHISGMSRNEVGFDNFVIGYIEGVIGGFILEQVLFAKGIGVALKLVKSIRSAKTIEELVFQLEKIIGIGSKAVASTVSKITNLVKTKIDDVIYYVKKVNKFDNYYEVVTPDGNVFRIAKEEIPEINISKMDNIASTTAKAETVWDSIKNTQPLYQGTQIPRSFEMKLGDKTVWVHGNATEHMYEDVAKVMAMPGTDPKLYSQMLLSDLQGTLKQATQNGIIYDQLINVGKWELKFSPPRGAGQLPALIHSVFKGW